jgi:hypothetical protein
LERVQNASRISCFAQRGERIRSGGSRGVKNDCGAQACFSKFMSNVCNRVIGYRNQDPARVSRQIGNRNGRGCTGKPHRFACRFGRAARKCSDAKSIAIQQRAQRLRDTPGTRDAEFAHTV